MIGKKSIMVIFLTGVISIGGAHTANSTGSAPAPAFIHEQATTTDLSAIRRGGVRSRGAVYTRSVGRSRTAFRSRTVVRDRTVVRNRAVVRPGWHGGGTRWVRPAHYWWRPGTAIAVGAAIGFVSASTAYAWAGAPPAAGYCWYYTDPGRTQGFWDVCP